MIKQIGEEYILNIESSVDCIQKIKQAIYDVSRIEIEPRKGEQKIVILAEIDIEYLISLIHNKLKSLNLLYIVAYNEENKMITIGNEI
jgi:hypothetical protein